MKENKFKTSTQPLIVNCNKYRYFFIIFQISILWYIQFLKYYEKSHPLCPLSFISFSTRAILFFVFYAEPNKPLNIICGTCLRLWIRSLISVRQIRIDVFLAEKKEQCACFNIFCNAEIFYQALIEYFNKIYGDRLSYVCLYDYSCRQI